MVIISFYFGQEIAIVYF